MYAACSSRSLTRIQIEIVVFRWDSSVAADQVVVNDEVLVAGLRKSRYTALQAGYMTNTPDKRLHPAQGPTAVLPTAKPATLVRFKSFNTSNPGVMERACQASDVKQPTAVKTFAEAAAMSQQVAASEARSQAASSRDINADGLVLASIVRGVVAASGVGCDNVVTSNNPVINQQPCWTTRYSTFPFFLRYSSPCSSYTLSSLHRCRNICLTIQLLYAALWCTGATGIRWRATAHWN